jgi:hypothetical protein
LITTQWESAAIIALYARFNVDEFGIGDIDNLFEYVFI